MRTTAALPLTPDQLSAWLAPLDRAALECDGMTRAIAILLDAVDIPHEVRGGSLHVGEQRVRPHFWVELPAAGLRIDYRARMWLEGNSLVPHGSFSAESLDSTVVYRDEELALSRVTPTVDNSFIFYVLTGTPLNEFLERYPA